MSDSKKRRIDDSDAETISQETIVKLLSVFPKEKLISVIKECLPSCPILENAIMNEAESMTECKNLFIHKLSPTTRHEEVKEKFSQFGSIVECTVKKDRATGKSKGFGFVQYDRARSAAKALESSIVIDGNEIQKNYACLFSKDKNPPIPASSGYIQLQKNPNNPGLIAVAKNPAAVPNYGADRKLFIRGLSYDVPDASVRDYFSQYGPITDFVVCRDHDTQKSKGYGFVTYTTNESTFACLSDPTKCILGRPVSVSLASNRNVNDGIQTRGVGGMSSGAYGSNGVSNAYMNMSMMPQWGVMNAMMMPGMMGMTPTGMQTLPGMAGSLPTSGMTPMMSTGVMPGMGINPSSTNGV